MKCQVCEKADLMVFYKGKIRKGRFPNFIDGAIIYRCPSCTVQMFKGPEINYETEEYRQMVDSDVSAADYHRIHDHEQPTRLDFFNLANFRGATCVDVGAGAGSFLDLIKGFAGKTVAIEPALYYHDQLAANGHLVFAYTGDALPAFRDKADLVTCFSVIEHVEDPVAFIKDISMLCRPGGTVILSTPNSDDWLIDYLPAYRSFFYRVVHKWYFNSISLKILAAKTGFSESLVRYRQRFPIANALNWIRDQKPSGNPTLFFSDIFETVYKMDVERSGKADYIYLIIKK